MTELADALAWAAGHARVTGPPEVRERPWATVVRLPSAEGTLWLKIPAPSMVPEVALYGLLVAHAPHAVLHPVARDEARGLLLLPDGDAPAEQAIEHLRAALPVYAELQRALAPHRDEMIAAGVPDASPTALVTRFDEAAGSDDPRRELVVGWAAALADAPGADLVTVDHQDLHPGNVLAGPRFYDWGDAVVAHPFASLLVALDAAARMLGVPRDDPAVRSLRDAYLEPFTDLAGRAELTATADLACRAAVVARALTWRRALASAGPDHPYADAPRATLAALGAQDGSSVPSAGCPEGSRDRAGRPHGRGS